MNDSPSSAEQRRLHPADNTFTTPSVTLASWLVYAHSLELRLSHYDTKTRLFKFWDPAHLAQKIIEGEYHVDPQVSLHKYQRIRDKLLGDKLRLDGQQKAARRAVRRG